MLNIYVIDDSGYKLVLDIGNEFKRNNEIIKLELKRSYDLEKYIEDEMALIVINEDKIEENIKEVIVKIRNSKTQNITPIIVVSSNTSLKHQLELIKIGIQYYIRTPYDKEYIYYIGINLLNLLNINKKISPLTGLPGNIQIQNEINKRLETGKTFAILYLDLDNFKSYNDVYGFSEGDEIIKFTAKSIEMGFEISEYNTNLFIGHIGGDDFVAITDQINYENVCKNIIGVFEENIKSYFTKEDLEKGYLEVTNRKGKKEKFPLTSISIGVVEINNQKFKNALEVGEVGAEVKKKAKQISGSSYFIDRRK